MAVGENTYSIYICCMITSKLPNVGTTIFTVMSALAAQYKAINLGQGFPDYPMNTELTELVTKAMKDNYNQYLPMAGYAPLLEAIAAKVEKLYATKLDAQAEITITPGGTYAIYTAITAAIKSGDEVIVFEPAYDSYIPNVEVNGGKVVRLQLEYPSYSINWSDVKQAISPKTKIIILNSPHNPTGAVLSETDIEQLRKVVEGTNIIIISDEVYEHLIYDDLPHLSLLRYPDLLERTFVCFSFGKVYNCTGWKMGYCIAPSALTKEFRKVHQFNCFCVNSPMQVAIAAYLQNENAYLDLAQTLQKKRDYFRSLMSVTPLKVIESHGSYFELYTYNGINNETEAALSERLVKECGVATIPVSAFYKHAIDNKALRFCFAKKESTLEAAVEKLVKFNW